jgi:hypothetical protein
MQPRSRPAGTIRPGSGRWWALAAVALVSVSAGAVVVMTIDPLDTVMSTQLSAPSHGPMAMHNAAAAASGAVLKIPSTQESLTARRIGIRKW